ncbi:hypothetical protein ABIE16_004396 [Pseudomonas sp. 2725]|jgi:hypothetical protein
MAAAHQKLIQLKERYREQARSHIGSLVFYELSSLS